mmetsp:Transcript_15774/g.15726  ORF Transcript_15774/g.15726 Transcript_15774/m.15726 type:complete len:250 (-) Transcript_15774:441-1190(-)
MASHQLFHLPVIVSNNSNIDMTYFGRNVRCNLTVWFGYIGYILVDTALLCKIYRIKLITDQPLRKGLLILPKHVMGPYIAILIITVGILIAWTAVHPAKFEIIDLNPNTEETMGVCSPFDTTITVDIVFSSILQGLILIVEIVLLILAWKVRHVNPDLGDSKRIFQLMIYEFTIHIISTALFNTLPFINAKLLITVSASFLHSTGIMGFLIVPRMYNVWHEHKHGHLPENVQTIGTGRTTVVVTNNTYQ